MTQRQALTRLAALQGNSGNSDNSQVKRDPSASPKRPPLSRALALSIPLIVAFSLAGYLQVRIDTGQLEPRWLTEALHSPLKRITSLLTDVKFRLRGPRAPKNRIIIAAIDDASIDEIGRWPWHRNIIGELIENANRLGIATLGLDVVFSEPEDRVPPELKKLLAPHKLDTLAEAFEGDPILALTLKQRRDKVVLGWTTESSCVPAAGVEADCPVEEPRALETHPPEMPKFAIPHVDRDPNFDFKKTPVMSAVTFIPNIKTLQDPARSAGFFNTWPDPDGFIRLAPLVILAGHQAYPTLALAMAARALDDELEIKLGPKQTIERLAFKKSGRVIPVRPTGALEINFRGPAQSFPYVSAIELFDDKKPEVTWGMNGEHKSPRAEFFRGAHVFLGASATGLYDMRAFPFDSITPGVEGHATILDNILSGDSLNAHHQTLLTAIFLAALSLGAFALAASLSEFGSLTGLGLFAGVLVVVFALDLLLFAYDLNLRSGLIYLEWAMVFGLVQTVKYVFEERQQRFVRRAFGQYISPKVVDSIVNDPEGLKLGGEKRELTVLFSDIQGFTNISENLDPKVLASFLNEYLDLMTRVIVDDFDGTLDKYIGDAIMAFWGAPADNPQHAAQAAAAAVRMQDVLLKKREEFTRRYGLAFSMGVGINTGYVTVGNMGSQKNFNYTAIGDHVNLASRLEGLTRHYGVDALTSSYTIDSIVKSGAPIPRHRVLDRVKVKGKRESVAIVQLVPEHFKDAAIQVYGEALAHYIAGDWARAEKAFAHAARISKSDPYPLADRPALMMAERCAAFAQNPPPTPWTGEWEMHEK